MVLAVGRGQSTTSWSEAIEHLNEGVIIGDNRMDHDAERPCSRRWREKGSGGGCCGRNAPSRAQPPAESRSR